MYQKKNQFDFENGEVFLVNKPLHWTSFDVVNKIRYQIRSITGLKKNKVGHAGTLDPLATGLLIICTGKMTKKIADYQNTDKEYMGTFFLGATTPSFDLETNVNQQFEISGITEEMVLDTAKKLTGELLQTPPAFSAISVEGKRAYMHAREGNEIVLQAKRILISEFEITRIDFPLIDFRVVCTKGTYIRSLVNDFGKLLDAGAYLTSLCRTKSGDYNLVDAWELNELVQILKSKYQKEEL